MLWAQYAYHWNKLAFIHTTNLLYCVTQCSVYVFLCTHSMFSMFYLGCNTILLCPLLCVTIGVCCFYVPICINILKSKKK
jgi:hypothetical protein